MSKNITCENAEAYHPEVTLIYRCHAKECPMNPDFRKTIPGIVDHDGNLVYLCMKEAHQAQKSKGLEGEVKK